MITKLITIKNQAKAPAFGAIFPNNNFKSFSSGVRFKSKHVTTLVLFDLFKTGICVITCFIEEKSSWMVVLCLLM